MDVSRKAFLSATDSKQFWLPIIRKKNSRRVLNTKLNSIIEKQSRKMELWEETEIAYYT